MVPRNEMGYGCPAVPRSAPECPGMRRRDSFRRGSRWPRLGPQEQQRRRQRRSAASIACWLARSRTTSISLSCALCFLSVSVCGVLESLIALARQHHVPYGAPNGPPRVRTLLFSSLFSCECRARLTQDHHLSHLPVPVPHRRDSFWQTLFADEMPLVGSATTAPDLLSSPGSNEPSQVPNSPMSSPTLASALVYVKAEPAPEASELLDELDELEAVYSNKTRAKRTRRGGSAAAGTSPLALFCCEGCGGGSAY